MADAKREVAEFKQLSAESQLQADSAKALVSTREAQLQAGLEKLKVEAEAKSAEVISLVKRELLERVETAERRAAERVEQARYIYIYICRSTYRDGSR